MYIPRINWLLYICCIFVVVYFQNSTAMESAYGLSISFAMVCTSLLLIAYMYKRVPIWAIGIYILVYGVVEIGFMIANITKFFTGGWVTIMLATLYISIMYTWPKASRLASKFVIYRDLRKQIQVLKDMKEDTTIPQFTSNLVYTTYSTDPTMIENSILYSILRKPKKADVYWFIYTQTTDEPHTLKYQLFEIEPGFIYRINMSFGFKDERKVNLYFNQIIEDLVAKGKYSFVSTHPSLQKNNILTDYRFILIDSILNKDYQFNMWDQLVMNYYFTMKRILVNKISYLGLDETITQKEEVPIVSASEINISSIDISKNIASQDNITLNPHGSTRIEPI